MWGEIIGAGITAAGSLLGGGSPWDARKGQRLQNEQATRNHPENVRRGAEKAGFNPLTYLMSNGGPAGIGDGSGALSDSLGGWSALGQAIGGAFENLTMDRAVKATTESANRSLAALDYEIRDAGGISPRVVRTRVNVSEPLTIPKQGATPNVVAPVEAPVTSLIPNKTGVGIPPAEKPFTVMDPTGLPAANPEYPREAETDQWDAYVNGNIYEYNRELWRRNAPPFLWSFDGRKDLLDGNLPALEPFHKLWIIEQKKKEQKRQQNIQKVQQAPAP